MPAAEEWCVVQNGFVHCVRMFLFKPETLAVRACGNVTRDIDKAGGPVEAGSLEFADRFVAAVMTCCATVARTNMVDVFR